MKIVCYLKKLVIFIVTILLAQLVFVYLTNCKPLFIFVCIGVAFYCSVIMVRIIMNIRKRICSDSIGNSSNVQDEIYDFSQMKQETELISRLFEIAQVLSFGSYVVIAYAQIAQKVVNTEIFTAVYTLAPIMAILALYSYLISRRAKKLSGNEKRKQEILSLMHSNINDAAQVFYYNKIECLIYMRSMPYCVRAAAMSMIVMGFPVAYCSYLAYIAQNNSMLYPVYYSILIVWIYVIDGLEENIKCLEKIIK